MRKPKEKKISTIVFDFDGTLADTFEITAAAIASILERRGYPSPGAETFQKFRETPGMEAYQFLGVPDGMFDSVAPEVNAIMAEKAADLQPFSGIPEMLHGLKEAKYRLGILTSNNASTPKTFIKNHRLPKPSFIYADSSVFGKDQAMLAMLAEHHLKADETLYVGDETRDILAAQKIGLPVAGAAWGYHTHLVLEYAQPDYLFDQPLELMRYFTE
jgi:HAD superfamily hydrolase (TIGR01549 family)